MDGFRIVRMNNEGLKGRKTTFRYTSPGHYAVDLKETEDGWNIGVKKVILDKPFEKEDHADYTVKDYKGDTEIYFAFVGNEEAGQIQFGPVFAQSVRVWDIDVWPEFRRRGIGKALMDLCKKRSKEMNARRIVLETQSSNMNAIAFYKSQGFKLIGMDASNYHNDDIERGEVRFEMAFHFE